MVIPQFKGLGKTIKVLLPKSTKFFKKVIIMLFFKSMWDMYDNDNGSDEK